MSRTTAATGFGSRFESYSSELDLGAQPRVRVGDPPHRQTGAVGDRPAGERIAAEDVGFGALGGRRGGRRRRRARLPRHRVRQPHIAATRTRAGRAWGPSPGVTWPWKPIVLSGAPDCLSRAARASSASAFGPGRSAPFSFISSRARGRRRGRSIARCGCSRTRASAPTSSDRAPRREQRLVDDIPFGDDAREPRGEVANDRGDVVVHHARQRARAPRQQRQRQPRRQLAAEDQRVAADRLVRGRVRTRAIWSARVKSNRPWLGSSHSILNSSAGVKRSKPLSRLRHSGGRMDADSAAATARKTRLGAREIDRRPFGDRPRRGAGQRGWSQGEHGAMIRRHEPPGTRGLGVPCPTSLRIQLYKLVNHGRNVHY